MNRLIPNVLLVIATLGCAAESEPVANNNTPEGGAGGSGAQGGGEVGGSGGSPIGGSSTGGNPTGGAGGAEPVYETAVGAAHPNQGDGRVVLIDATGTRLTLFNPSTGGFESADDIDELQGAFPLSDVVAAASLDDATYYFDALGDVVIYDHAQATFGAVEPLDEALEDVPFASIGAAFGLNNQLFVFNQGGASYAAYNVDSETWSPVYQFTTDFGGGGAPIPSVGASYAVGNEIMLFDLAGTSYCVYANGQFSDDFDIEDLGDGSLTFTDSGDD